MNKSVPTLLGVAIILLVVIAVFTVFQYRFYSQMASGAVVVGTSAHQMLTGAEPEGDQVSATDVIGKRMEKRTPVTVNPQAMMNAKGREGMAQRQQMRRDKQEQRMAHRGKMAQGAPKPG